MINSRKFDILQILHLLLDTNIDESFDIIRRISHDRSLSFETFVHNHSSSLEIFTHDRSSSLDALVTIAHRFLEYSSRSLIVTREFHLRFLDIIYERSTSIEVVKNKLIEARVHF